MKKGLILALTMVCALFVGKVEAVAQSYKASDTDITITTDSDEWIVITRDNVIGNSQIKSVGVSEKYFYDTMMNTNSYIRMFMHEENSRETVEFRVIKENTQEVNNFKNLSDKKLNKIAKEITADRRNLEGWELYSNDSSYILFEYKTSEKNYIEYYTVVNQEIYRLVALKTNKFTQAEKEMIKKLVDDAQYTINPVYANETSGIAMMWDENGIQIIVVVVMIILVAGGVVIYKKRKAIKSFFVGKKEPKDKQPKPRYVEVDTPKPASKPVTNPSQKSASKAAKDSSMVTIDRQKRNARKK